MNIPSWINPTQSFTVVIDYYSLSFICDEQSGEGSGRNRELGGGINFLPLKRGGLLEEGACLRGWGGGGA